MKMMNSKQQGRLDGFFTVKPKDDSSKPGKSSKEKEKDAKGTKRKVSTSLHRLIAYLF